MKKFLLGATALSMAGFAGSASAQEWSIALGGFAILGIGYVDNEQHLTEVALINDGEVHFDMRLVADNGISFAYDVEMEAQTGTVDESYGTISGSFGRVEIGSQDGAHDQLIGSPAGNTAFTAAADGTGLLFDYYDELNFVVDTDGEETGDSLKISYFTPSFSGFRAGISYAPNDDDNLSHTDHTNVIGSGSAFTDAIEVGAAYSGDFGDFSVGAGVGATFTGEARANGLDNSYGGSLNVGFGGFSVGGRIAIEDGEGAREGGGYGLGLGYETGPWTFGAQYAAGLDDDDGRMGVSLGADYVLAPGVTTGVVLEFAENDDLPATDDDEAFALGAFMALNF